MRSRILWAVLVAAFVLSACGEGAKSPTTPTGVPTVAMVTYTPLPGTVCVLVGSPFCNRGLVPPVARYRAPQAPPVNLFGPDMGPLTGDVPIPSGMGCVAPEVRAPWLCTDSQCANGGVVPPSQVTVTCR